MAPFALKVAAAAACTGLGGVGADVEVPDFDDYMKAHGLEYSGHEYVKRQARYNFFVSKMRTHNSLKSNLWQMGLNKFSVLSEEEMLPFFGLLKGEGVGFGSTPPTALKHKLETKEMPEDFDWRSQRPSVVTAVKSQGACGSCWAFASTAVIESCVAIDTGYLYDLSPQQLTSCTPNPKECGGSGGCTGATAQIAFDYVIKSGMASEWEYSYTSGVTSKNGECEALTGRRTPRAGMKEFVQLPNNDADALMRAVLVSPVAVSVAAGSWAFYSKGIFNGCDENPVINHAVVLMGFGKDDGNHYWAVRNSWGPRWGEKGYIRLLRSPGDEHCGEDAEPLSGYSCKDSAPKSIKVCGMCGILADSAYPSGCYLGTPEHPEDPAIDDFMLPETLEDAVPSPSVVTPVVAAVGGMGLMALGLAVPVIVRRLRSRGGLSYAEVEFVDAGSEATAVA